MTTIDPDFEAAAASYFKEIIGETPDPEAPPDSEPEPEPELPEPVPGEEDQPEPPEPEVPDDDPLAGLTREQIAAYRKFDDLLKADKDLELTIAQRLGLVPPAPSTGPPVPAPEPYTPAPPPLDLDDPSQRWLYDRLVEQDARLSQVTNAVISQGRNAQAQNNATNEAILNRAFLSFKEQHGLSDVELSQVADAAGRLNVLPALLRGTDPFTGVPGKVDALSAIEKALDLAYWQFPDFRQREVAKIAETRRASQQRKQKAGALSGNSGSAPRRPAAVPTDEIGRRKAMVDAVAQYMQTGSLPEE